MEYFNSLSNQNWQNIICKWEETPSTMNEMMSIHGVPTICHEEDENGIIFSLAFSDKAIAILDKTIVKPLLDLNLENWLDVIDKEKIRIQFYREIATGYVGYYAFYNIIKSLGHSMYIPMLNKPLYLVFDSWIDPFQNIVKTFKLLWIYQFENLQQPRKKHQFSYKPHHDYFSFSSFSISSMEGSELLKFSGNTFDNSYSDIPKG